MDKLLLLESPLFYNEVASINKKVIRRIRAVEESSFNWLDEILEDARSVFNQSDNICLLPKTPSAKRKGRAKKKSIQGTRRKIQVEEDEDDYVSTQENKKSGASKQANKRVQEDLTSDEDFDCEPSTKVSKVDKSPVGRKTRATSRAATTTRARNTRKATNTKKNKSKSQEPVLNIEQFARNEAEELLQTPKQTQKSVEKETPARKEVIEEWIQSAGKPIKRPSVFDISSVTKNKLKDSLDGANASVIESHDETMHEVKTEEWIQPANELIRAPADVESVALKVTNAKTPIQNFNSMNVKEKVHAYEEIILISPMTTNKKRTHSVSPRNSVSSKTSPQMDTSVNTPSNAAIINKTPDTVVNTRTSTGSESLEQMDTDEPDTPVRKENKSSKKNKDARLSKRLSVSKSLAMLPSALKMQALHSEVPETKPTRARTRLRLKKKEKPPIDTESEQETTADDQTDSQDEDKPTSSPQNKRQTRSLTRKSDSDIKATSRKSSQSGKGESSESDNNTEPEKVMCTPKVVRSTRTKTRQAQNQVLAMEIEKVSNKDSGLGGSSSSIDGDGTPRATRSKIRKPKEAVEVTGSDGAMASPAVTRVTRTKTRKRQHEDEPETDQRKPKRSCTSNSSIDGPTKMSADEQSSEDEVNSPVCPPNKVIRPVPSFLNSLNKNSNNPIRPANLQSNGLVKSFLVRNSPAPKPTLSEIQAKRKQELQEKERKERERLKRREEEQGKKMEEMKKKREEKMKKVQEMREQRQRQEKENRMQIERRLVEKRQQTQKLREEKIKEEKEKQKMRLQKMEEAEERRKQDEEERQKKLHEQLEQEKFHEEMLQRKKEFEEQERQQKIEDEKRQAVKRQLENEREREKEKLRLLKIEEEKKKEWQKKKGERERLVAQERAEKEKLDLERRKEREIQMKREMEKIREQERIRLAEQERIRAQQRKQEEEIKKMVHKHNTQAQQGKLPKPNMNKTHSLEEATVEQNTTNNDSYEMTPKRVPMASTMENYGIDDLNSGDETDDDECPRKRIPDWAQGSMLKTLLIKQHYHPPNFDELFDPIEPPDLNLLFEKKKARFNKRTSSAHWDSPILKPGLLGRV